jgi:hypothetical protein
MKRSLSLMAVVLAAIGGVGLAAQGSARAVPREFAHVKKVGRALAEFKDDSVQVVAAYYYSQRNHDSPWLLIELGALAQQPARIDRKDIDLVMPGGRVVPLATQERWGSQIQRNKQFMQQVEPTRHQVASYFKPTNGASGFRFFTQPGGNGTVLDFVEIPQDHVALGDLLFEAPTRIWEKGTYALVVRYDGKEAVLPIELE